MFRLNIFIICFWAVILVIAHQTGWAQVSITATDTPYFQDFNTLANTGTSSSLPTGWALNEVGGSANSMYTADNGGSTGEDTYSYGATSNSDRAFGHLDGALLASFIGASFTNNTGSTITSLLVQYYGEQWRLGAVARTDRLDFQYSTNATALNNGTWTDFNGLDFTAPVTSGSVGPLDGNASANRTLKGAIITGLSIPNGSTFWIRWSPFNAAGSDDGLAIDDFILSANPQLHYQISTAGSVLTVTDIAGNGETIEISESGSNIRFFAPGRTYSLNSGATTALPFQTSIAAVNAITCSAGAGNDTIDVGAFTTSMKDFTLNGGTGDDVIIFNGDITFATNEFLNVDLQNDDANPGIDRVNLNIGAHLALSGVGSATIKASRSIQLASTAVLETVNGNMTLEANQQTTPTSGNFQGIVLNSSSVVQVLGAGALTLKGKGGNTSSAQHGVHVNGGLIVGSASNPLTIIGTGGASASNSNYGLHLANASSEIMSAGDISITATGGGIAGTQANFGIFINIGSISTSGNGEINISANGSPTATLASNDGIRLNLGGTIEAEDGDINITGTAGGAGTSATNVGITLNTNGLIQTTGTGNIFLTGNGSTATGINQFGFQMNTGSSITTSSGSITINGYGGDNSTSGNNVGVQMNAGSIAAGGLGSVTINGEGGNAPGSGNYGVYLVASPASISSAGGDITITGTGGGSVNSATNYGVYVRNGSAINGGGSANVNVTGTGGPSAGSTQIGIHLFGANSAITSVNGNVIIAGTGGGNGSSGSNTGVNMANGIISSGGTGNVTVMGAGGSGSAVDNVGVKITNADITTANGNISILGFEGIGSTGVGFTTFSNAEISTTASGGDIIIQANSMYIGSLISTGSSDSVRIMPLDDYPCHIGPTSEVIGGPLMLSDTELDSVFTGHLVLGSVSAGQVFVLDTITRTNATNVYLRSVEEVELTGGYIHTNGGNLVLDPGTTSTGAYPDQPGVDAFAATVSCAGKLHLVINGLVADTDYHQLNVNGNVNLTGASLVTSGTHVPVPGETFIIINNDGADPVTGTFTGLPQGSYVTAFLGSNYPAQISYVGGDGNDVVLTVASPDYIITTAGNNFILTDMAGNSDNMTINQSGSDMILVIASRNFSLNGGAVTSFPASIPFNTLTSVTFNTGNGNDNNTFNTFSSPFPHLTFNGGQGNDVITFIGDINFISGNHLDLNLEDDDPTPGTDQILINNNANLKLFGSGTATIKVSKNVELLSGASLETVDGDLTIETNQQSASSSGTFNGLSSSGALIQITGSGQLSMACRGGMNGTNSFGILLNGADIIGGSVGQTEISGTGGINGGSTNYGIYILSTGASVTTNGSNLELNGFGGSGLSGGNIGIVIIGGALVSSGGNGDVLVNGTGGPIGVASVGIYLLQGTIISSNGDVEVNGMAGTSASGDQQYGVFITDGSTISAGGVGHVEVNGIGGVSSFNNNYGVYMGGYDSSITSAGGSVTVTGNGGGTGSADNNYGVYVRGASTISAGGTGNVEVIGVGGDTNGDFNYGVYVFDTDATITSSGGDVSVNGTASGAGGESHIGVSVRKGALITAGGNGNVMVEGTGAFGTLGGNNGVMVHEAMASITSSGGNVTITGNGGGATNSFFNHGLLVSFTGFITAGNNGSVIINATGGALGGLNFGVYINGSGSSIHTPGGDLSITCAGGGNGVSGSSPGLYMLSNASVYTEGAGNVTIQSNAGTANQNQQYGMYMGGPGAEIYTENGNITIDATGGINGMTSSFGVLLQNAEIYSTGSGEISIESTGGSGVGSSSHGLQLMNSTISTVHGDIEVLATGGGNANASMNYGMRLESSSQILSTGSGSINIIANGGTTNGGGNVGAYMVGLTNGVLTTSGNISISATGYGTGSSNGCHGLYMAGGSKVLAGNSGQIVISGVAGEGTGDSHFGLFVDGDETSIASLHGDVDITGIGGGSGSSSFNYGITVLHGAQILSAGNGNVAVQGTGGGEAGADFNHGVLVGFTQGTIRSTNGNVAVTGFGGGSGASSDNNYGVFLFDNGDIETESGGTILIQGTGGPGTGTTNIGIGALGSGNKILGSGPILLQGIEGGGPGCFGVFFDTQLMITTDSLGGNIGIQANSIYSNAIIETPDTNSVTIWPYTAGVSVYLDETSDIIGGPLVLSQLELDPISTGLLQIGTNQTDSIWIKSDKTRTDTLDIVLKAGGDILFDTGAILMTGGNLLLDCGASPKAIQPQTKGLDVDTDTLTFGSDLLFRINGTIPDSTYDVLTVNGVVNLSGVDLKVTGSYFPSYADTFLIVDNDGIDPIVGTFTGLAEGAIAPMFLGSNTPASITYLGGDGNDVVITILTPDYQITDSLGHLVVRDLKGNSDNMTLEEIGLDLRFNVPGRTFSYNYGSFTVMPANIPYAVADSITLYLNGGNDQLTVNNIFDSIPSLTINGGLGNDNISMNSDLTFKKHAYLNVDLQNDEAIPGTDRFSLSNNVNVVLSGNGDAVIRCSRNITLGAGASLVTENGDLIAEANMQAVPTAENFVGISLFNSDLEVTGTGALIAKGKAGSGTGSNFGIQIDSGGSISGGTFEEVLVEGTGGGSNTGNAHGIALFNAGSIITSSGADVQVIGYGGGSGAGSMNIGVVLESSSMISAGGMGSVTVNGTGGTTIGSSNAGIRIFQLATITSSGGNVTVTGTGGGSGSSHTNNGINVVTQGMITAGGNGTVTVVGTGGTVTGNSNYGVVVSGNSAMITTSGGDLFVTGQGGGLGSSGVNIGVSVTGQGKISPGGTGHLFIEGTGGLTDGGTNYGVSISQSGSLITSAGGNVNITGTGGGTNAASSNHGISVISATISAGGLGHVNATGTGGATTGAQNVGMYIRNSDARVTSSGGNITLEGYGGGTGTAATGIGFVLDLTGMVDAGGDGYVNIYGQGGPGSGGTNRGVFLGNSMITSAGGNVTLEGQGGGLSSGNANEGIVLVSGAVVTAGGTGSVSVIGTGSAASGNSNSGIELSNSGTMITSSGGNVQVIGHGGNGTGAAQSAVGISLETSAKISAGGLGNVTVQGTGGMVPGSLNFGVSLNGLNTMITSSGGNVAVEGIGNGTGSSANNFGVFLANGSVITAGGDGTVTVSGSGGTGTGASNYGVYIDDPGTMISSTNGAVIVTGTGGGSGSSSSNYGVYLTAGGQIGAGGDNSITVDGFGGNGSGGGHVGVGFSGTNSKINATTGDVFITGTGGNGSSVGYNYGVAHNGSAIETHGEGNIVIEAFGGTATGLDNSGFVSSGGASNVVTEDGDIIIRAKEGGGNSAIGLAALMSAGLFSTNGNIELKANSISLSGLVMTSSADSVWIHPFDMGIACELTSSSDLHGGPLRLSDTELDYIFTGTITYGDTLSDSLSIIQPVTRTDPTDMHLVSGDDILFTTGSIHTNNGQLLLDPGVAPDVVKPLTGGVEVITDSVLFAGDLAIRINGTTVDTQYDQLNVNGHINLNGVDLILSGSYTPMEDDSFMIVKNDLSDLIFGTFIGFPEGDTIPNFMGGTLPAVITYIGGDGNDVVIHVVQPCIAPDIPTISISQDTICEGSTVTLTITAGNMGQATDWHWYSLDCGVGPVDTGLSIQVNPLVTTTYFARAEGGCVIAGDCGEATVTVNPFPDASFSHEYPDTCYYRNHTFEVIADEIPGATYSWTFGSGATPSSATGYGPHIVYYSTSGTKEVKLVIDPNAAGADCPDSTSITFPVVICPGNIVGKVLSNTGAPIASVNVRLFADADTNGVADNSTVIRSIFTPSTGIYNMSSLTPGHYVLVETQPIGWASLDDYDLTDDGDVVDNVDSLDNIIPVTVLPLEFDSMNTFIEIGLPGTITGTVFDDFNGNQQPNTGEGLPDVVVKLLPDVNADGMADSSTPLQTIMTDAQGNFNMPNVPVGHYVLVEEQPAGMQSIKDFDASNDADLVPNTNQLNDTIPVTITNAETDANNYFIEAPGCGLVVNNTNDDGPGSFRQAIGCATAGDTILFNPILAGSTIQTLSDVITLAEDVVIYSTLSPRVTIESSIDGHFLIGPGAVVEFRGLDIVSGLSPGNTGAAFENTGTLILHDTGIIRNPFFNSGEYLIFNHPGSELEWRGVCELRNN